MGRTNRLSFTPTENSPNIDDIVSGRVLQVSVGWGDHSVDEIFGHVVKDASLLRRLREGGEKVIEGLDVLRQGGTLEAGSLGQTAVTDAGDKGLHHGVDTGPVDLVGFCKKGDISRVNSLGTKMRVCALWS